MQSYFRYLATLLLLFTVTTLSARWGKISPWLRLKVDKYHQEKIQRQASPRLAPEDENEEVVLFLQTWQFLIWRNTSVGALHNSTILLS